MPQVNINPAPRENSDTGVYALIATIFAALVAIAIWLASPGGPVRHDTNVSVVSQSPQPAPSR